MSIIEPDRAQNSLQNDVFRAIKRMNPRESKQLFSIYEKGGGIKVIKLTPFQN